MGILSFQIGYMTATYSLKCLVFKCEPLCLEGILYIKYLCLRSWLIKSVAC